MDGFLNLFKTYEENDESVKDKVVNLTKQDMAEFRGSIIALAYCSEMLKSTEYNHWNFTADIFIAATSFSLQEFFLDLLPSQRRTEVITTNVRRERADKNTLARQKTKKKSLKTAVHNGNQAMTKTREKKRTGKGWRRTLVYTANHTVEPGWRNLAANQNRIVKNATAGCNIIPTIERQKFMKKTDDNTKTIILHSFQAQQMGKLAAERVNEKLRTLWTEEQLLVMKDYSIGATLPGQSEMRESRRLEGGDVLGIKGVCRGFMVLRQVFERIIVRVDRFNKLEEPTVFEWEVLRKLTESEAFLKVTKAVDLISAVEEIRYFLSMANFNWLEPFFEKRPSLAHWERVREHRLVEQNISTRTLTENEDKEHPFATTLLKVYIDIVDRQTSLSNMNI